MSLNKKLVDWTPALVARCRMLWEVEGLSASRIAEWIGHGATKNTVIGKAHREGWQPHKTGNTGWHKGKRVRKAGSHPRNVDRPKAPRPPRPSRSLTSASKPKKATPVPPAPIARPAPPPATPVAVGKVLLLDLKPGECRWPMNAPERGGQYLFCGEPIAQGSYCRAHAEIGYQKGTGPRRPGLGAWVPRPVEAL